MNKLLNILKLMRPKQWIKNMFVFGALIFSNSFTDIKLVILTILAFIAFCLVSSSVYVLNDIVDIEKDKAHPKKCKRPLASGDVSIPEAIIAGVILVIASLSIGFYINISLVFVIILYLANNLLYSFKIKNIVLLDIFSIAVGFILRILAGSVAIDIMASKWIVLCTLFLSLYLGFGKRRNEIILLGESADNHRKILNDYSIEFLDQTLNIVLTCTVVFYAMYTAVGNINRYMIGTTVFVIYGVLRYNYLIFTSNEGGSPTEVVLEDKPLLINILLWVISCIVILTLF